MANLAPSQGSRGEGSLGFSELTLPLPFACTGASPHAPSIIGNAPSSSAHPHRPSSPHPAASSAIASTPLLLLTTIDDDDELTDPPSPSPLSSSMPCLIFVSALLVASACAIAAYLFFACHRHNRPVSPGDVFSAVFFLLPLFSMLCILVCVSSK
jgi:hypothetical protein